MEPKNTRKIHPHPWTAEHGQIKEVHGWVIGNYPYTLGDEMDHQSGALMAKAPEILEAAEHAQKTIMDFLESNGEVKTTPINISIMPNQLKNAIKTLKSAAQALQEVIKI